MKFLRRYFLVCAGLVPEDPMSLAARYQGSTNALLSSHRVRETNQSLGVTLPMSSWKPRHSCDVDPMSQ